MSIYKRIIFFIFIIAILTSCGAGNKPAHRENAEIHEASVIIDAPLPDKVPYAVYTQTKKYGLSLYEPEEGRYAGAYILSDEVSEIEDFEALAGSHSMYLYDIKVGDIFPIRWFLSCMANSKTPYIVVNPQNGYDPYNIEAITQLADELSRFYVPVFVDLYPNAELNRYSPEEYKEFFKEAGKILKKRASNAAIVFSVPYDKPDSAYLYYPGDEYVDWVGINVRLNAAEKASDVFTNIENIYFRFQKEKPIMISSLAVSHISGENYVYRTKEAAKTLGGFYESIITRYPRIKGVNYLNINGIEKEGFFSDRDYSGENYLVTDENIMLAAYENAVSDNAFIEKIDYMSCGDISEEYLLSPFPAYLYENEIYISSDTVCYDLNIKGFNAGGYDSEVFNGETYYKIKLLEKSGFTNIRVDQDKRTVYFDEP